ncbi:hypothetical protein KIW84_011496 [Lathyrus oleraceus]|uniref:Uncharacterized protein n=1 Tax=Pisum sativum TaxID=3888 RepID=A0A9D5BF40_PEA|nr:hypothetical protein KIW84_011496 [Pisum sativum]
MKDNEYVDEYFARTLTIINKMIAHGEKLEQITIVEKVSRSMTPKFNYVRNILLHEQGMKIGQDKEEEQVLKISNYGHGRGNSCARRHEGIRGHGRGGKSRD